MSDPGLVAFTGLLGLGAWHGLNPGMGWLFAVALGMQEGEGRAVWRALPPLAVGHALAVGATVGVALLLGRLVPLELVGWLVAALLVGFGVYRLLRQRHPRYGGMRVGFRQLAVWSFLMASAHGAGLMVVPFVLSAGRGAGPDALTAHAHAGLVGPGVDPGWATLVHTASYLLVAGVLAWAVYRYVGVRWLRTGWFNLDLLWGGALVLTGLLTPLLV